MKWPKWLTKKNVFRVLAGLAAVLMLGVVIAGSYLATQAETEPGKVTAKSWIISKSAGRSGVVQQPLESAFWEFPIFNAGETKTGSFSVKNDSDLPMDMILENVNFPYNSELTLRYLQKLYVVLYRGNELVFEGDYTDLIDFDTKKILSKTLEPKEEVTFSITLKCAFSYDGEVYDDVGQVTWGFVAADHIPEVRPVPFVEKIKMPIIIASSGLLFAILLSVILRATQKRRLSKENNL